MKFHAVLSVFVFLIAASAAYAKSVQCWDNVSNQALPVMNQEVLNWKQTTKNQYKDHARVQGRITRVTLMRASHAQFEIQIGDNTKDTVEVIYNREFGELPNLTPGMVVEACGDYITSNAPSGHYQPSPSGAIIHWVHYNPGDRDGGKHESGYVILDGVIYGQAEPPSKVSTDGTVGDPVMTVPAPKAPTQPAQPVTPGKPGRDTGRGNNGQNNGKDQKPRGRSTSDSSRDHGYVYDDVDCGMLTAKQCDDLRHR